MGRTTTPNLIRLGHSSSTGELSVGYFHKKNYAKNVELHYKIRELIKNCTKNKPVCQIEINESVSATTIVINLKRASQITKDPKLMEIIRVKIKKLIDLYEENSKNTTSRKLSIQLSDYTDKKSHLNPAIITQDVVSSIANGTFSRKNLKNMVHNSAGNNNATKIVVSGRINGVEMATSITESKGKIGASSLKNWVSYSSGFAKTQYGTIGVKVTVAKPY